MAKVNLPNGHIIKGPIEHIFHKQAEGKKKEYFTYKVRVGDKATDVEFVKSSQNTLKVGDLFFSTVRKSEYEVVDEKTNATSKRVSLWEAQRLAEV